MRKQVPKPGDKRVKTCFLWLPAVGWNDRTEHCEWRWLERVTWVQAYTVYPDFYGCPVGDWGGRTWLDP